VRSAAPYRLQPTVQFYEWGSDTAIAELLGVPPDGRPQAELWLGAHPSAPAHVDVDGTLMPLDRLLTDQPLEHLGAPVLELFGRRLPFLFKVLAAARPLSLQVHPTLAQAREGYAREEAAAMPRRAAHRTYRDRSHKPELVVALTPFDALSGFRPLVDTSDLLSQLARHGADGLRRALVMLQQGELGGLVWEFWDLPQAECRTLVGATGLAAARLASSGRGRWHAEAVWIERLAGLHPGDPGVLIATLLNLIRLKPGQGLYAPPCRLHGYLEGVALEIMANSDNVIRGGLTTKHIDIAELEHVLRVWPETVDVIEPTTEGIESVYLSPAAEFRLSRLELAGRTRMPFTPAGPEILLCLEGTANVNGIPLERGEAVFVPAALAYELAGPATVWRATVGSLQNYREPERRSRPR
jgi:mannose-6-phosphate isomerase